jgi:hypothetical protein
MDVSVILSAHAGGLHVVPSIRSIEQARAEATEAGVSVEVLVVADRPNRLTEDCLIGNASADGQYIRVDFGDAGIARNEAVRRASGAWVAFLEEGDLFCSNWIRDAFAAADSETRPTVWHPEFDLHFGEDVYLSPNPIIEDSTDDRLPRLVYECPWGGSFLARRELLLDLPFLAVDEAQGVGREPWGWHLRTLAAGRLHKTVPDTCNFLRGHRADVFPDPQGRSKTTPMRSGCFTGHLSRSGSVDRGR